MIYYMIINANKYKQIQIMLDAAYFTNHSIDQLIDIIKTSSNSRIPPRGKSSKEMWRRRLIVEVLNLYRGASKGFWAYNVNYNVKGTNRYENTLSNIKARVALVENIPIESVPALYKL